MGNMHGSERIAADGTGSAWVSKKGGIFFNDGKNPYAKRWTQLKDADDFRASDIAVYGSHIFAVGLKDQKVFRFNKDKKQWKKVADGPNAAAIDLKKDGEFYTTMIQGKDTKTSAIITPKDLVIDSISLPSDFTYTWDPTISENIQNFEERTVLFPFQVKLSTAESEDLLVDMWW